MPDERHDAVYDFLARFDTAKGHFKAGQREWLLAMREVFAVFADLTERSGSEALGLPAHLLRGVVALLDYLIAQFPENGEADAVTAAKIDALRQLVAALETEITRVGKDAATQVDLAKVEALQSVVRYLKAELDALADDSAPARQRRQRITKIDVE
ncbi:MAG: hypothetical protein M5R36_11450 [Deltaproteobacteria bacterium]|nr:hypothetical protein [Deltaproteobacteria bacterium]